MLRFELLLAFLVLAIAHHVSSVRDQSWSNIVGGIDYTREEVERNCPINSDSNEKSRSMDDVLQEYPELSSPTECARTCQQGQYSKTCYYRFVLEYYTSLTRACDLCTSNYTNGFCNNCQCVTADGVERPILTVNRMIPGPSIEVCEGDKVIVDVQNLMGGEGVTIHWHGILQRGTQYNDGAAFVTQCPIPERSTFRYKWIAEYPGTQFWHAHTAVQKMDGIFGSLIVRQPANRDPNSYLYDYDLSEHVVVINDWLHELSMSRLPGRLHFQPGQRPDVVLINGKGRFQDPVSENSTDTPLAVFNVEKDKRYRFRMVNAFCTVCPGIISVEDHTLIVIAADGVPIKPMRVNSIASLSGERYDFVINTDKNSGSYWIQLRATGPCAGSSIQQLGVLRYGGELQDPLTDPPTFDRPIPQGVLMNALDGVCDDPQDDGICISELTSALHVDKDLLTDKPDMSTILSLSFYQHKNEDLFEPNTFKRFLVTVGGSNSISRINGISFEFPSSPLLTEADDLLHGLFCNQTSKPDGCGDDCSCTQVINLPYKGVVELIFVDEGNASTLTHPLHLHGYVYQVLGMGQLNTTYTGEAKVDYVRELHSKGLLVKPKSKLPPGKDTLGVPSGGYAVVRFRADNPGYWLFHCHFIYHMETGMALVFHVGDSSDLPPIPEYFPKCGNYYQKLNY